MIETLLLTYFSCPSNFTSEENAKNLLTFISFISCHDPSDSHEDKILVEGMSRFCDDLKLDPASFDVLLICWKFRASVQCEFTRKEFVDGMLEFG